MSWLFVLVVLVALAGCGPPPPRAPGERPPTGRVTTVRIGGLEGRAPIIDLPLDEYVAGVVAGELGPAVLQPYGLDAARLQAVLARTYALSHIGRHRREGFDLCATTHCQLFRSSEMLAKGIASVTQQAARDTRERIILHAGRPIDAVFHADCAGHTSDAADVWGRTAPPYLRGVADAICPGRSRPAWQFVAEADALREALNSNARTRVGDRLNRIEILATDEAGRALRVALDGHQTPVVRAEEFRQIVTGYFGPQSLRSTRFRVTRRGRAFIFEGHGSGHGVGLCLAGAFAHIRAGRSLEAVVSRYFPGTQLAHWPVAALASR